MKTYTPELDATTWQRLADYAAHFAPDFPQAKPARWSAGYLQGLRRDGERKSIAPLARRVTLPPDLPSKGPEQALQQFVNQSPWDEQKVLRRYRALLAQTFANPDAVFVIDDTSFPKQGQHSVGVQRQYGGAWGQKANCQVAVSVHYVSPTGHYPLALRLYLPESWLQDPPRLDEAGGPAAARQPLTQPQIALTLLDQGRAEGLRGQVVVTDAGYGDAGLFRQALADRGLFYLAGGKPETVVVAQAPTWQPRARKSRGPAPTRWQLAPDSPRPLPIGELAQQVPLRRVTWREGSKGKLSARCGWVRVGPGPDWHEGKCAHAAPLWLLIEEQAGGQLTFALSNLPPETSRLRAVRLWKSRWPVEQGYQQMKEELGLDHCEGRSWRGFHHHAALVMLAYGFLALERHGVAATEKPPRKKKVAHRADAAGDPPRPATPATAERAGPLPVWSEVHTDALTTVTE